MGMRLVKCDHEVSIPEFTESLRELRHCLPVGDNDVASKEQLRMASYKMLT
jgi:hypothetical protein